MEQTTMPTGVAIIALADGKADDCISLAYHDRFRRRVVMQSDGGLEFLLDLPKAQELPAGSAIRLSDGRVIAVVLKPEPVMVARPGDPAQLAQVAWHVGNRHMTCEIHADHLVLQHDAVIAQMLEALGCTVVFKNAPFQPMGGAFGHGRTHSHQH